VSIGTAQAIYEQLGLKITYLPGQEKIRADVTIRPEKFLEHTEQYGAMGSVRGPTQPIAPYNAINCSAEVSLRNTTSLSTQTVTELRELLIPGGRE
jgi:hypothetical protein